MFGIDISNHQAGIDLSKMPFDFGIVKATEGCNFIDPSFRNHVDQLTRLDKLIGCYCFARPDNQNTIEKMIMSADFFVNTVYSAGILTDAILILDWEQSPVTRIDLMLAWLKRVEHLTDALPIVYINKAIANSYSFKSANIKYPIWVASWPSIRRMDVFPTEEWIKNNFPKIEGRENPIIWQYSSSGRWPGFNGRVDFDYANLDKEDWCFLASGEEEHEEEFLSQDMEWAIAKKLFIGYSDGTYKPREFLTRGEAATILHRLVKNKDLLNGGE